MFCPDLKCAKCPRTFGEYCSFPEFAGMPCTCSYLFSQKGAECSLELSHFSKEDDTVKYN